MAQIVSRRLFTASSGLISRQVHVGFVVEKVELREIFRQILRISLPSFIPPMLYVRLFILSLIN
jgi:hypothetical protein